MLRVMLRIGAVIILDPILESLQKIHVILAYRKLTLARMGNYLKSVSVEALPTRPIRVACDMLRALLEQKHSSQNGPPHILLSV